MTIKTETFAPVQEGCNVQINGEDFVLREPLKVSHGGIVQTFLAKNVKTGRGIVFKKILTATEVEAQKLKRRFQLAQEARNKIKVAADCISEYLAIGSDNCHVYAATSFVEGTSWEKLENNIEPFIEPFSENHLHSIIDRSRRLFSLVYTMSSRGVVHRDVAPDNVIIGPRGTVRLTDVEFMLDSLDSSIEAQEDSQCVVGKFITISPEILCRSGATCTSDVYSAAWSIISEFEYRQPNFKFFPRRQDGTIKSNQIKNQKLDGTFWPEEKLRTTLLSAAECFPSQCKRRAETLFDFLARSASESPRKRPPMFNFSQLMVNT